MADEKPNPNKLKLWFSYTGEEKSYVVYRGYQAGVLNSQEVESYLQKARLNHASNILFPVLAFPFVKAGVFDPLKTRILKRYSPGTLFGITAGVVGSFWLLWLNWSPLYRSFDRKREELLEKIEKRIGPNLRQLNDVLPRFWTEGEVSRKTRKLYNQRNSWLTGYLYPYEEAAEPLVDQATFAKKKKNKVFK